MRLSRFCSPKTITCARLGKAFFTSMKRVPHACLSHFALSMMVLAWCVAISVFLAGETSILRAMCPWLKMRQKLPSQLPGICLSHRGRSEHTSVRLTHILRPTLWHSCHHASAPGNRCILLLPDLQGQVTQLGSHCTSSRFQYLIGDTILPSRFFCS